MRICTLCKQSKPLDQFYGRRGYYCKLCYSGYQKARRERCNVNYRRWLSRNRALAASRVQACRQDAPWVIAAVVAKRNARKLHATPLWANSVTIKAIYEEAAWISTETGVKHQVDHIIPLQGALVCGLHVAENLQIIPSTENQIKSNSFNSMTF